MRERFAAMTEALRGVDRRLRIFLVVVGLIRHVVIYAFDIIPLLFQLSERLAKGDAIVSNQRVQIRR